MKVLLVDQIAKVNYKYTFPLANGLEKAGAKVLLAIDQKQEKENCRCERINLFNTDEKNVGKLEKMQNYIASYKKIGELLRTEKFDVLHTPSSVRSNLCTLLWRHQVQTSRYAARTCRRKTGIR